jgi:hypothetical protein
MKKIKIAVLAFITIILFSCNFSAGVEKDLSTGLTTKHNGLNLTKATIVDNSGATINPTNIKLGQSFDIVVTGVENFTDKNGKAFPGCKMQLIDKAGKAILDIADAYAEMKNGASIEDVKTLTASFKTGSPMVVGETYKANVVFFDKEKTSSTIDVEVNIKIK